MALVLGDSTAFTGPWQPSIHGQLLCPSGIGGLYANSSISSLGSRPPAAFLVPRGIYRRLVQHTVAQILREAAGVQVPLGTYTVEPKATQAARLRQVLLPQRLQVRAHAAAGLSTWLAVAVAAVSIVLAVEIIGYINAVAHGFLEIMFARWETVARIPSGAASVFLEVAIRHMRPHVIPSIVQGSCGLLAGLFAIACLAALLESINLVLLAPLAVGCGQRVTRVLRRTRRVLLTLGGVWLLEWSVVWLVVFLGTSALVLRTIEVMYIRISYTLLDDLASLSFQVFLAGLLLAWVTGLTRAAALFAPPIAGPLPPRCSRCGYLLTGVPADTPCRECGLEQPAQADALRGESPWLDRHRVGWYAGLSRTCSGVLFRPTQFFARLKTLADVREVLRFVHANLWLSIAAWLLAAPGIAAALIDPDDIYLTSKIVTALLMTLRIAAGATLAGTLLIGLLISLLGFAVNRTRDEAVWPIAASAGCYLAAVLPRVAAVQALWVTVLFTVEQGVERGLWLRLARYWWTQTGVPWEVLLSLVFGAPMVLGMLWLVRSTVACYRGVRFAGR